MSFNIYSIDTDEVINGKFVTGKTDYKFAIKSLFPLIDKLDIQRKLQNPTFYKRLREDIMKGCIMPPITLAFIMDKGKLPTKVKEAQAYINKNISKAFILDGIQRINALNKSYTNPELLRKFPEDRPLFVNIIICKSMDNLLYRMITLNNGQRPMTANHQIEILLGNIYKFENLDIVIQTEKQKGQKGRLENSFDKSNLIKAYLAFISNSTAIDNNKIIESKLNELIAKKIMDSKVTEDDLEFSEIIDFINIMSSNKYLKKWFDNTNNIIGFSVGARDSYKTLISEKNDSFESSIQQFENAFSSLNLSTIKLSKERRNLSKYFISNYGDFKNLESLDLLDAFNEKVL